MKELQRECAIPMNEAAVGQLAQFLDGCLAAAEIPATRANKLRIAGDEVAANLAAYSGAARVTCHFAAAAGAVTLAFWDDGAPFDPLAQESADTAAPAEQRPLGGLGLLLVKRLMREVTYRRADGQNVLTLTLDAE